MSDQRYDIYFSGEIIQGHAVDEVHLAVGKLFNITGDKLAHLFSGTPVRVKVDVDEETAVRYRLAFREAGALVQISASKTGGNAQTTQTETASTDNHLELLPAKTGDLLDCAKPDPVFEQPELSGIHLAPAGTTIDESQPVVTKEIDTHNLSMSDPRTGSLEDIQIKKKDQPIPDISHLHLDD